MKIHRSNTIKPPRLKEGGTIGIVAPAWSFDPVSFKKGTEKLIKMGYKVKYDRSIFNKYWSMAGYDKKRAEQINEMFADKEVNAIFCAAAGYGSVRTLPHLNSKIIRKNPKIFVGYSDITVLLTYLYMTTRLLVFHGPVVADEIRDGMSYITLDFMLSAITQTRPLGELKFHGLKTLRHAEPATGVLVGGNMSLIVNTIGTPYEISTENKILFLEDIGEDLEVIDSYIMQLKLSGKLKKVKGIVFGRMIGCSDHSGNKYSIRDILNDILQDVNVPIIYGFPSGHSSLEEINITLPFGASVTLVTKDPKLVINEAGVC